MTIRLVSDCCGAVSCSYAINEGTRDLICNRCARECHTVSEQQWLRNGPHQHIIQDERGLRHD